jgi:hypothetical protein
MSADLKKTEVLKLSGKAFEAVIIKWLNKKLQADLLNERESQSQNSNRKYININQIEIFGLKKYNDWI